jgi:hypothetical protein
MWDPHSVGYIVLIDIIRSFKNHVNLIEEDLLARVVVDEYCASLRGGAC